MLGARQFARSAPRLAGQARATAQRRLASTSENQFISERQHIKEHAKGSTGTQITPTRATGDGQLDLQGMVLTFDAELWRKISV